MGKLKVLAGRDVVGILSGFGFHMASQKGSHIKLVRLLDSGERQILTIPLHNELDRGTLKAIIRQASRYISEEMLKSHFYEE
ncbi:type II toxin-antitoxin system HicA family toxin [Candidatus Uhrbacteria bacterium]|nr:type II toxin-antitoxin system HicA family toxin [Candidatus Uhrbacteria bacterium]